MSSLARKIVPALVLLVVGQLAIPASAHSVFKRIFQRRYDLESVSCTACHVEDEDRSERNELGLVFYKRLEGKELSARFAAAKRDGFESRRRFEEIMGREFLEVIKDIEPVRSNNGRTFGARFRSGDFPGLRSR